MSVGVSEALLMQKIDFLLTEINELKRKEETLKRSNECLLNALGNPDQRSSEISLQELKKTIELQEIEIRELKIRYKDKIVQLEGEKQELLSKISDLEFALKQQKLLLETEKLELVQQIQRLENDKIASSNLVKSFENEKNAKSDVLKYQQDIRIVELNNEIELIKVESRNEIAKARQESEKVIIQLKGMYEGEIDGLRNQINSLQDKYRKEKLKIEEFFSQNDLQFWQHKVEELENELDLLRSEKNLKKIEENESIFISSKDEISEIPIERSKKARTSTDFEFENLVIQNERLKIQSDRARLENSQLLEELERCRKESSETESALKTEVKFLIGKLLKAKSKLSIEGELSESLRRDLYLNTIRYKNCEKNPGFSPEKYN